MTNRHKSKQKKILVLGGTGSIGKSLIPKLISNNFNCFSISKKPSNENLINNIQCDITEFKKLNKIINKQKPDVIIHLAGLVGNIKCEKNPKNAILTNVIGTLNVLNASIKLKPKIIFISTGEIYGKTKNKASEKSNLRPTNVYGKTKMLSEILIQNFTKNYQIPSIILRLSYCYSENLSKKGFSLMFKNAIMGKKIQIFGGDQTVNLLHIDDAVDAIIKSIDYKKSGIFNIASSETYNLLSIIKKLNKIMNQKIDYELLPYRGFEVKTSKLNINHSKKTLKFTPSKKLDEVLRTMVSKWK
jgi:nucleoside-diphosphate-sugar epimerase